MPAETAPPSPVAATLPTALANAARWRGLVVGAAWGAGSPGRPWCWAVRSPASPGWPAQANWLGLPGAALLLAAAGLWPAAALLQGARAGGRGRRRRAPGAQQPCARRRRRQALFSGGADAPDLLLEAERIRLLRPGRLAPAGLALPPAALAGVAAWWFLPVVADAPGLASGWRCSPRPSPPCCSNAG